MSQTHVPDGYHSVTPSLTVRDADAALDFYAKAFGAVELFRLPARQGKILHAEFQIGNSRLLLADESDVWDTQAPEFGKGCAFMIYVPDVDVAYFRAIGVGASTISGPQDMFWGDRIARLYDPFGYRWTLATNIREVSPEEILEAASLH